MSVTAPLESLLFASPKPLHVKKMADALCVSSDDVRRALDQLTIEYNAAKRGVRILKNGESYQMATAPEHRKIVQELVREDGSGECTRPQLETLTIIAYRGPITKTDLEQVRGVHSGLILRNLTMRGLIDSEEDATTLQTIYRVSFDFLRWLGIHDVKELPNYEALHKDARIEGVLAMEVPALVEVSAREHLQP